MYERCLSSEPLQLTVRRAGTEFQRPHARMSSRSLLFLNYIKITNLLVERKIIDNLNNNTTEKKTVFISKRASNLKSTTNIYKDIDCLFIWI